MSSKLSGFISRSSERMRAAVELEDAEGVAAAEQFVGGLVVQREAQQVDAARPWFFSIAATASAMIVRLRRPRKSIFSRPRPSQVG